MNLYFTDIFTFGRAAVTYKDFLGQESVLFEKAELKDEELEVFNDFNKPLAIVSILGDKSDKRVDDRVRQYLLDKAKEIKANIERMTDAEYDALCAKATAFRTEVEHTADSLKYSKSSLSDPIREKMIDLLQLMIKASKIYTK